MHWQAAEAEEEVPFTDAALLVDQLEDQQAAVSCRAACSVAGLTLQLCHGCTLPFQGAAYWHFIGSPPPALLAATERSRAVVASCGHRVLMLCGDCSAQWLWHHAARGIRLPADAEGRVPNGPTGGLRCATRQV